MDAIFCGAAEVEKTPEMHTGHTARGGRQGHAKHKPQRKKYIVHTDAQRRGTREEESSVAGFHTKQAANKQLQDEYSSV